jgi:hypothetical protein
MKRWSAILRNDGAIEGYRRFPIIRKGMIAGSVGKAVSDEPAKQKILVILAQVLVCVTPGCAQSQE